MMTSWTGGMSMRAPLLTISYRDPAQGFEGMLVIDSLVGGVAGGGLRVTKTVNLEEVTRLARGMTLKNAVMGLPLGGAKSALRYDPLATDLEDALVRFFEHIRPLVSSMYGFGPDMNTPPDLCDAVARRAGMKSRHMALAEKSKYGYEAVANYDKALRMSYGPLAITDARTSIGVTGAVETGARVYEIGGPLRVAVQGFGSVGMGTCYFLEQRGHTIVAVADGGGSYRNPAGLDVAELMKAKAGRREIDPEQLSAKVQRGKADAVLDEECDVLVLAAIPDAVNVAEAARLRCKLIVEGGNFAVAPAAFPTLQARNIPIVPDFIASGGAIATVSGIIQLGWSIEPKELLGEIEKRVSAATERAARDARAKGITMREAGRAILGDGVPAGT
jgi:glutamate dehydrogenase (NAD(P)+)